MEIPDANVKLNEGRHGRLGYAWEFKNMIREHPGVLKAALQLTKKAEDQYNPPNMQIANFEVQWNKDKTRFDIIKKNGKEQEPQAYSLGRGAVLIPGETLKDEQAGLEVTILGRVDAPRPGGHRNRSSYFKMKLGDHAFFIKKSIETTNKGYEEFKNSHRVQAALSGLGNVAVVEANLGYDDDHQSWFVSKWQDLEDSFSTRGSWFTGVNDYGYSIFAVKDPDGSPHDLSDDELAISNKIEAMDYQIMGRLEEAGIEIYDLTENLFYNPKTDKFFLLDVTTYDVFADRSRWLGQPK